MRLLSTLILVLLMLPATARASDTVIINYTCPVDGVEFSHFATGSDYISDNGLDLQPIGMSSYPWPAAQCPNDGMIMYKTALRPKKPPF